MAINKFYKRVLDSLDVKVVDDYLMIDDGDNLVNYNHNGTPLVLPTKEHISTLVEEDDSGNIVTIKHLFNPLDETVIKGDSVSLRKFKKLVEVRLANRVAMVGSLLLTIGSNPKLQTKSPMLINQFLMRLNEAKNPGITKVVDDKTISNWRRLYDGSFNTPGTKFMSVFVKKGGKLGATKYNRLTTFKFPIYEELLGADKNTKINGVSLRNKDITLFKVLFEYLIDGINDKGIVTLGSNDTESPGFISLYGLYLKHSIHIQNVLSNISGVDAEWEDASQVTIDVDITELDGLSVYKRELSSIPREGDLHRAKLSSNTEQLTRPSINEPVANANKVDTEPSEDASTAAIRASLYGNGSGVIAPPVLVTPQTNYPTPTPGMVPGYPQPGMPVVPQMPMAPMAPAAPQIPVGYGYPQPGMPVSQYASPPSMSIGTLGTTSPFGRGR